MNRSLRHLRQLCLACALVICGATAVDAAERAAGPSSSYRVFLLQDYNTRVVLLGTTFLGMSGGIVGVFMLLRKRSLIGDVIGHSALPGIAIAFIVSQVMAPGSGKNLPLLMSGAFLAGLCGALCVMLIERNSPIRADAALAIVLSLFYGLGTALLTVIQRMPTSSAAGLQFYLNGKTASLLASDVWVFALSSLAITALTLALFKELTLLCFDDGYASASGWPVMWLDALLVGLVAGVTIVGMQTVGLILVVAILIIPAASARFWTNEVHRLTWIAAALGGISAAMGTLVSAMAPRLAAGAVIVLSGSCLFLFSLLMGTKRGLFWRWLEQQRLQKRIGSHDLLRAAYEKIESLEPDDDISEQRLLKARLTRAQLQEMRSWSPRRLSQLIRQAIVDENIEINTDRTLSLTPNGAALARRAVRNHRLWEIYLITYADIAPSHADYDADRIEHVLGPQLIRELEERLAKRDDLSLPASPHSL
ncbi:iron chelate uptake ABC transporter family permease subunit [Planctomicrobium sp. SH661]|uniref:metal ABC transporter permease n=1 Tax=Planctomicrobium sp. SH661 TaxID=3448124 RepID=UPI003F5BBFD4